MNQLGKMLAEMEHRVIQTLVADSVFAHQIQDTGWCAGLALGATDLVRAT